MNFSTFSKDLQSLHNHDLLARAREIAHEERRAGVALLIYLREIERRRLFALNHSSLHEYVVRELGYSDGAAHRRISAMRLMSTIPEVEDQLRSGALTLSTASQVQNFLRAEKKLTGNAASTAEMRQIVAQVEGKSTRETEALLAARAPEVAQHLASRKLERPRVVGTDHSVQVTLTLSRDLQLKLQRLRDRTAHRDPNPSLAQQIEWLADFALAKLSGASDEKRKVSNSRAEAAPAPRKNTNPSPRYISPSLRREVWLRAGHRCEMLLNSGLRCSRTHLLQIDHLHPVAWGGASSVENLQLLCAVHNQLKSDRLPDKSWTPVLI